MSSIGATPLIVAGNALLLIGPGLNGWGVSLLMAAGVTLAAAVCSFLVGTIFGIVGAIFKLSSTTPLRWLGKIYTTVFRGVPEILVVYALYFGSSLALTHVLNFMGYRGFLSLPSFAVGVLAIGLVSGAYQAEAYRAAYYRVDQAQIDAGRACGMSDALVLYRIIAPQSLRFALPALANLWQSVIKDTALLSVISLLELLRESSIAAGSTRQPLFFYCVAGLIYLVIGRVTGLGLTKLETRLARPWRR